MALLDDNTTNQTATETETTHSSQDNAASPTSTETASTETDAQTLAASHPDVPAQPQAPAPAAQASVQPAPAAPAAAPASDENQGEKAEAHASDDFATALENYETEAAEAAEASEDRVIQGTVVKVTGTHVVVDIGAKSEGMVPIDEVRDHEGNVNFKQGDTIPVLVERGQTEEGYTKLSYQKAARFKAWEEIEAAYNNKTAIKGRVADRVKGGLAVDIMGARAFLPGSQVDVRPVRNLDGYKGQELEVRIIKLNRKRGNIVVSRKQLLEESTAEKRGKTLEQLHEGSVLTGTVKNLTQYGAFVDLGGIDGLLHITDMSWGRLTHPRDLVNVGDEIQVKVLKYDPEKQRVSLGFKQLTPDPWTDATHRYPVGAHVKGRVISTTDYGAFIELEQGIEGLVHVSEMTWSKRRRCTKNIPWVRRSKAGSATSPSSARSSRSKMASMVWCTSAI
jgi:small subunit ribosomal protein S1